MCLLRTYLTIQSLFDNENGPGPISESTVAQLKEAAKITDSEGETTYVTGVSKYKTAYAKGGADVYMIEELYRELLFYCDHYRNKEGEK